MVEVRTVRDPAPIRAPRRTGRPFVGGFIFIWAVGVLMGMARTVGGWRRVAALARSAQDLDGPRHGQTLERVRAALGVKTLPCVATSPGVRGPVAVGLLKPRILLPEGLADSIASEALRDVLVHECAHVVRLDEWVGLLQRVASVLLWPRPLVHYASGQLTRAREEVCDNYVLRFGTARAYVLTLLTLTERCLPLPVVRPGLGLLGTRWTLADRVLGLLDERRMTMTRSTMTMKGALALGLGLTGLTVASLRFERRAVADQLQANQNDPNPATSALPRMQCGVSRASLWTSGVCL